jgi:hypothetical protein
VLRVKGDAGSILFSLQVWNGGLLPNFIDKIDFLIWFIFFIDTYLGLVCGFIWLLGRLQMGFCWLC